MSRPLKSVMAPLVDQLNLLLHCRLRGGRKAGRAWEAVSVTPRQALLARLWEMPAHLVTSRDRNYSSWRPPRGKDGERQGSGRRGSQGGKRRACHVLDTVAKFITDRKSVV